MTFTVPSTEPTVLRAGETWHWTRQLDQFPASEGWTLTYYVRGVGKLDIVATTATDGTSYDVLATAQNTSSLGAGRYTWDAIVSLGSGASAEVHTADSGVITVQPNLATSPTGANQTHNEKMLAMIEAELERRLTGVSAGGSGTIEAYVIHGRSVTKMPIKDLKVLRGQYLAAVTRERNPGRIGTSIGVTFGPTQ